jgi:putative transposase
LKPSSRACAARLTVIGARSNSCASSTRSCREAAQPLIHHAPARERFAFIDRLRDRFSVKRPRRVTITDRGSFYGWGRAQVRRDERTYDKQELTVRIVEIHTAHSAYGAERITRELKRQDIEIGRRVVTRLMQTNGISGVTRRRRRNLTKPDTAAAAVPDLIRREFTAPMPGLRLTGTSAASRRAKAGFTSRP